MRGVAVLMVLASHLWIVWPSWTFEDQLTRGGFLGIELFFALSGFLITRLLLDEQARTGTIDVLRFYLRRALRLFPALWVMLGGFVVYQVLTDYPPFGRSGDLWGSIQAALLYVMNWRVLRDPDAAGHLSPLWSLAIEEHFYLVWPFVVIAVIGIRRRLATVVAVLGLGIVAVALWRWVVFERDGWPAAYLRTDTRMEGLLWGSLAGCLWIRGRTPQRLPRALLWAASGVVAALVLTFDATERRTYVGGITLCSIAAATIVLVLASRPPGATGPVGSLLQHVGRLAYGLYLWQLPVLHAFERWGRVRWSERVQGLAALATIFVLALASRALVELPALRLRGRLARSGTGAPSPVPPRG